MVKSIITALAALVISFGTASAQSADCTRGKLIFTGNNATGLQVSDSCPGMSRNLTFKDAKIACPHGFVILEPREVTAQNGGAMTKVQKDRGDTRVHFKCDWATAQGGGNATVTPPPPRQQQQTDRYEERPRQPSARRDNRPRFFNVGNGMIETDDD